MRKFIVKYLIIKCIFALLTYVNIVQSCTNEILMNGTKQVEQLEVDWNTKRIPNEFIVQFIEYFDKDVRRDFLVEALKNFQVNDLNFRR